MKEYQVFRKIPVEIKAVQWFKNGDHPEDYPVLMHDKEGRNHDGEGHVVRYYRHPIVPGTDFCTYCNRMFHDHGWIDTVQGGHLVCPGDWIITDNRVDPGEHGHYYPCKPGVFEQTYEPVGGGMT